MASEIFRLDVFISAPKDVDAQRKLVQKLVLEIADELEDDHSVRLKPFFWEDDAIPGIAASGQGVISRQIIDKCDIYIGLLGQRFGTPTSRAGSGTEEEFDDVYKRYVNDTSALRVLFYFKKTATDAFTIDLEQLQKVLAFRDKLQQSGVLYKDFETDDQLIDVLRKHLRTLIREEWKNRKWMEHPNQLPANSIALVQQSAPEQVIEDEEDEDGVGFLDALEIGEEAIQSLLASLKRIADHSNQLNHELVSKSEGLSFVLQNGGAREAKAGVNSIADSIFTYGKGLSVELPTYTTKAEQSIICLERLSAFHFSEGIGTREQIEFMPEALSSVADGMRTARASMREVKIQLDNLKVLTNKMKRAKRFVSELLDDFGSQTTILISRADTLRVKIEDRITETAGENGRVILEGNPLPS